jgi:hypothetical protein
MAKLKKADLEALIVALLRDKRVISVATVAQAAQMSKTDEGDRKAVRRALTSLVERGLLELRGAARSRTYVSPTTIPNAQGLSKSFKDIHRHYRNCRAHSRNLCTTYIEPTVDRSLLELKPPGRKYLFSVRN